jgi:hypothetical protein
MARSSPDPWCSDLLLALKCMVLLPFDGFDYVLDFEPDSPWVRRGMFGTGTA